MGTGFKQGAAGGAALNFKVVGSPQPASPKENTIWVDTDAKITGWIFSASRPENPAEGMVWFNTGSFGTASFNALKRNGIQVYPQGARQYLEGAWVVKPAQIYQSGAWANWMICAFYHGNMCEQLTGGWVAKKRNTQTNAIDPILTVEGGVMTVDSYYATALNYFGGTVQTVNKIDMSQFSKIRFHVTGKQLGPDIRPLYLGVTDDADSLQFSYDAVVDAQDVTIDPENGAWMELDVSQINVPCVIAINPRGQSGGHHSISLDEIVLEGASV